MSIVTHFLTLTRYLKLSRQARELEEIIASLPANAYRDLASLLAKEMASAVRQPLACGGSGSDLHQDWTHTADLAFERAQSSVVQLKLKGIALWLATVYHETQDAEQTGLRSIHRKVLGFLGLIKGTYAARERQIIHQAASSAA